MAANGAEPTFVSKDEPQFDEVYRVQDGVLRIRAHHDLNYQDPEKWGWKEPGPKNPSPPIRPESPAGHGIRGNSH